MLFEKNLPLGAENFVLTGVRPIETLPQLVWTSCSIDAYKVTVALGKIESHILKLYSSKIIQSDMARLVLRKSLQAATLGVRLSFGAFRKPLAIVPPLTGQFSLM